jgi:NADH-quinone oxidoreductase subunit L
MALGASAYSTAIFHLMTHAFFKAVLFLGAGSVIIAMHHEQDMRRMGGLWKYMPITYGTVLIAAFANAGFPPFAGFFSKDSIIEALHASTRAGSGIAYAAALGGVFIGALYSFRMVFFAFHGKERFAEAATHAEHGHDSHNDHSHDSHGHAAGHAPHESPWVVWLPLVLLAIPSIAAGWLIGAVLYGDYFGNAIFVAPEHVWIAELREHFHGVTAMMAHGVQTLPFWLAVSGLLTAFVLYVLKPEWPGLIRARAGFLVNILERKYGFDDFNQTVFAGGAVKLGRGLWRIGDMLIIDGLMVNGTARLVGWLAGVVRWFQAGYIYTYAIAMLLGVLVLLSLYSLMMPNS